MHHYDLLRNPYFTWVPRPGSLNVSGQEVSVDFLDERKFAHAAALKAQAGLDILNSTYLANYVDDPDGQWQGYKDTDPDRAWGVTEWARRAGMGAYFDWLTANTILESTDPDATHAGIYKIDRQTVDEISQIPSIADQIQQQLDRSDAGLNPVGLAKGAVPFDIDPAQVTAGKTHFEQIYDRAVAAMNNAMAMWNQANKANQLIRQNQDSQEQFAKNVSNQDTDYKNRLIEIFGYPYAGDIGPGQTFASGYDGPDLYHYNYVNATDVSDTVQFSANTLNAFFAPFKQSLDAFGFTFPTDGDINPVNVSSTGTTNVFTVNFPLTLNGWSFVAPASWGSRRAPGEIQMSLSDLIQSEARLKQGIINHDNAVQAIQDQANLIQAKYNLRETDVTIGQNRAITDGTLVGSVIAETVAAKAINSSSDVAERLAKAASSGLPTVEGLADDCLAPVRGAILAASAIAKASSSAAAGVLNGIAQVTTQVGIPVADAVFAGQVASAQYAYDQKQMLLKLQELIRAEEPLRAELSRLGEVVQQNIGRFQAAVAKGQQILEARKTFAIQSSAETSTSRYQDMTFRVFRNDALQKYSAAFSLAQRYVFQAGMAYDYETCLLGTDNRAGQNFLTDIIRQRALGEMDSGVPVAGPPGLADSLARMGQDFQVLKTQLGFNNPETETGRFSLRSEFFRLKSSSDDEWRNELRRHLVTNVWDLPEFRRYCRPFAPETAGPQPALVIHFPTSIQFGYNYFGLPLSGGDSAYDPSRFATRVRSVGLWFSNYNGNGLSQTPRVYLAPVGMDVLRPPNAGNFDARTWRVIDQALPVPFTLGSSTLTQPSFIPSVDSLGGTMEAIRQFASFRAYHDAGGFDPSQVTTDSRLIGRSVWNTDWVLIIPGGTFLSNADAGLDGFINSVSDIKLFFQTYSYAGE
jgi:hypothetical protein